MGHSIEMISHIYQNCDIFKGGGGGGGGVSSVHLCVCGEYDSK